MGILHFLNVKNGDCSIIKHNSGRVSVIDICNGNSKDITYELCESQVGRSGNYNQKSNPVCPIDYLEKLGIKSIMRFILTHPDMDHMDGIKRLFYSFNVTNFWDTENNKTIDKESDFGEYKKEDWEFYQKQRRDALHLYDGSKGAYYSFDENGSGIGDGLSVLCPTREMVKWANDTNDYNNCSYVILYRENNRKILFCGDSGEEEWDYLLKNHSRELQNLDVLIAPHHGRKSGGKDGFLNVLNPKLTLFGVANSNDLNYQDWNNRKLKHFTNNQGGSFVLHISKNLITVYCTNKTFAESESVNAQYNKEFDAWHLYEFT